MDPTPFPAAPSVDDPRRVIAARMQSILRGQGVVAQGLPELQAGPADKLNTVLFGQASFTPILVPLSRWDALRQFGAKVLRQSPPTTQPAQIQVRQAPTLAAPDAGTLPATPDVAVLPEDVSAVELPQAEGDLTVEEPGDVGAVPEIVTIHEEVLDAGGPPDGPVSVAPEAFPVPEPVPASAGGVQDEPPPAAVPSAPAVPRQYGRWRPVAMQLSIPAYPPSTPAKPASTAGTEPQAVSEDEPPSTPTGKDLNPMSDAPSGMQPSTSPIDPFTQPVAAPAAAIAPAPTPPPARVMPAPLPAQMPIQAVPTTGDGLTRFLFKVSALAISTMASKDLLPADVAQAIGVPANVVEDLTMGRGASVSLEILFRVFAYLGLGSIQLGFASARPTANAGP